MEFFGVEAFIFTKFFRGRPIFFRDIPNSSEVNPYLMAVFRGECNFSQSSGVSPQLGWGGGGGVRILNAIAHCYSHGRLVLFEFNSKPSYWYV